MTEEWKQIAMEYKCDPQTMAEDIAKLRGWCAVHDQWDHHESAMELYGLHEKMKTAEFIINDLKKDLQTSRASNARLRAALEKISKNSCCETCQEAKLVALSALATSDGQKKQLK